MVICLRQIQTQVPAGWEAVSQAAAILTIAGYAAVWHQDISACTTVVS